MKTLSVLSVDDNALSLRLVQRMLAGTHMMVDDATSPSEAIAKSNGQHYDCALVDITLPGIGGVELAHTLRTGPFPIRYLIACTAHPFFGQTPDAAGFNRVLLKPFNRAALLAELLTAKKDPARP